MNEVDIIFCLAWGSGALAGLVAGFLRAWISFAFLLAAVGFGGALGLLIGPGVFPFLDGEDRQAAAGFFLIFLPVTLIGVLVTNALRVPLGLASASMFLFPAGFLLNRLGGAAGGALYCGVFVSILLILLQQWPAEPIGRAIADSSFSSEFVGWVDRIVASIEISDD